MAYGILLPNETARDYAYEALAGVGDLTLGQWEEFTHHAFHLRRRLSKAEQKVVGEAVDIRGTKEQERRWRAVMQYLPPAYKQFKE